MKMIIYSDFVCPWCYIAEKTLDKVIEKNNLDVEIEYRPYELRREVMGFVPPSPERKNVERDWNNIIYPTAKSIGLNDMKMPEIFPEPMTYYAHEGTYFAAEHGLDKEYVREVLNAYFEKGLDIGDIGVLSDVAEKVGLDRAEFEKSLNGREFASIREDDLDEVYSYINCVPSILYNQQIIEGYISEEEFLKFIKG